MPNNKNAVAVIYNLQNSNTRDIKIQLYPLLTCRHYHNVVDRHRNPMNFTQENTIKEVTVSFPHPKATVVCRITEGTFTARANWVDRLTYREENSRGEANLDDCFQPGFFEVQVPSESKKMFAVSCAAASEANVAKQTLSAVGGSYDQISSVIY